MRTRSAAWRVLTQSGLLVTRHPTSSAAKEEAGSAEMSNKRRVKEHKSGQKTQNVYKQQRIWRTATRVWFLCRPVLRWCPRLGMVGPTDGVHRASIDRRRHSYHSHQPTSHWLILISFLLSRRSSPIVICISPRRSIIEFRNWGFSQRPGLRVQSKVHLRCNNLKAATSMNTEYRIRNRGGIQRTQL